MKSNAAALNFEGSVICTFGTETSTAMRLEIPDHKILVYELTHPIAWGEMDALGACQQHGVLSLHGAGPRVVDHGHQRHPQWCRRRSGDRERLLQLLSSTGVSGTITIRLYVANPGRTSIDTFVSIERTDDPGVVYAAGGATLVWVSPKMGELLLA